MLDACAQADGQWVNFDSLRKRCISHYTDWSGRGIDKTINDAIDRLHAEGKIEIREPNKQAPPWDPRSERRVRLIAGPVEPG